MLAYVSFPTSIIRLLALSRLWIILKSQNTIEMAVSIIPYSGLLFRADEDEGNTPIGSTANAHYPRNYTHQFFTLTYDETSSYRNKGVRYTKKWEVNENGPLLLLDIMDFNTRSWVLSKINNNNSRRVLHIAFPVRNNTVYRRSNNTTVGDDRTILNIMCGLTLPDGRQIDGYYMVRQENLPAHIIQNEFTNVPISKFHSEIGLCKRAFGKITLRDMKRSYVPFMNRSRKKRPNRSRSPNRTLTLSRLRSKSPNRPASAFMFDSPPRAASASMFDSPNRAASAAASASASSLNNSPPRTKRGLF